MLQTLKSSKFLENANKFLQFPIDADDEEIEVRRRCQADDYFFRY